MMSLIGVIEAYVFTEMDTVYFLDGSTTQH